MVSISFQERECTRRHCISKNRKERAYHRRATATFRTGKVGSAEQKKPVLPPFPICTVQAKERERSGFFFSSGFVLFSRSHKLYAIVVARSLQFLVAFGKNNVQSSFRCNELAHNSQPKKTTIAPTIFFHKKGVREFRVSATSEIPAFLFSPRYVDKQE